MSMHLHHPSLSLGGKRKGKVKFRNAAEAARARELDASWKELLKSQGIAAEEKRRARAMKAEPLQYKLSAPVGRETAHIASRDTGHSGAVRTKDIPQYTGNECIGIGQLHKSNGVPIFRKQDAEDLAKMRR
jgi:hypothetical protein